MASFTDSYSLAQKKYNDADLRVSAICKIVVTISIILACLASPLAKHCFSYDVTKEVTEKESYQHPVGTVDTFICYTTQYGDCYHARGCGSLWKSSYKTTMYEAKEAGYRSCSKCTPSERTTLTLTEKRYRNVTRTKTETKEPAFLVWLCGAGCLVVVYYILTIKPRKQRAEACAEMQRIKEEETKIQREQAERDAQRKEDEREANNMRVLHSLGADSITLPKDVTLLQDGTPVRGQTSRSYPYGNYTVFISPSGRKFHKHNRCYRNLSAIHLLKLPKGYTPCKNCASSMQYPIIPPTWYIELTAEKAPGNRDAPLTKRM